MNTLKLMAQAYSQFNLIIKKMITIKINTNNLKIIG